jgi:hypothetical protein
MQGALEEFGQSIVFLRNGRSCAEASDNHEAAAGMGNGVEALVQQPSCGFLFVLRSSLPAIAVATEADANSTWTAETNAHPRAFIVISRPFDIAFAWRVVVTVAIVLPNDDPPRCAGAIASATLVTDQPYLSYGGGISQTVVSGLDENVGSESIAGNQYACACQKSECKDFHVMVPLLNGICPCLFNGTNACSFPFQPGN